MFTSVGQVLSHFQNKFSSRKVNKFRAFITYQDSSTAKKAVKKFNQTYIENRLIQVKQNFINPNIMEKFNKKLN